MGRDAASFRAEVDMNKLRAAIYSRHSTDKQNVSSSADRSASCEGLLAQLGAELVGTYEDPEVSGYRRDRPGLMRLLRDIADSKVDIVVCEALDRIARDGEDISWLGKKLSYHRVRLHTHVEGPIDEIKLAVAGLLGSMFLTNLRAKTFRGLKAAALAGRLAGGKAYGYRKVARDDGTGRIVNGVFKIEPMQADVVRRIYRDFADGRSSIQIATALNAEKVPGPRGGEWNASTIRGDPNKLVGILNNPLYEGKMVWGRREWRKNPDSDRRERRYRLRDQAEWIEVDMPDLRIVDEETVARVRSEIAGRRRIGAKPTNPSKHLLSGLIRCGECGSSYTMAGKDYYRCARNRERGTCSNSASVRTTAVEEAALKALHTELLTPDLVRLFTAEFRREIERLTKTKDEDDAGSRLRLTEVDREISNLAQHFLAGTVSPTLVSMLAEREAEKASLLRRLEVRAPAAHTVVPHPTLVQLYERKVSTLREALNDDLIRVDAIESLRALIGGITVHVDAEGGKSIEVEASTATLINFAQNAKAPRPRDTGRSVEVVAGTGFEPVTFRL